VKILSLVICNLLKYFLYQHSCTLLRAAVVPSMAELFQLCIAFAPFHIGLNITVMHT